MEQVNIIGIDLTKWSFSLHGARAAVAFRRTLGRPKVFLKRQPKCVVAMDACGGSHYWGREIAKLGDEIRLPVKPQR